MCSPNWANFISSPINSLIHSVESERSHWARYCGKIKMHWKQTFYLKAFLVEKISPTLILWHYYLALYTPFCLRNGWQGRRGALQIEGMVCAKAKYFRVPWPFLYPFLFFPLPPNIEFWSMWVGCLVISSQFWVQCWKAGTVLKKYVHKLCHSRAHWSPAICSDAGKKKGFI